MPVRVALARVNRSVRALAYDCAPTAIARATNTINMAYSVAVAPLSSRQKRLVRLFILTSSFQGSDPWPVCAKGDHSRHSASSQTDPVAVSGLSGCRHKSAFCDFFFILYAEGTAIGC